MPHDRTRLSYVVAHPMTTRFLRGQLAYMSGHCYEVALIASPGTELDRFRDSENARVIPVPIEREIRPWHDLVSLCRLYCKFRSLRPHIVNAGTPKAGLLAMLAARAAGVPVRIYTLHGLRLETARGAKRWLLERTERIAMRSAHRVVCVSPSVRDLTLDLRLAPVEKLIVLGSGSCNGLNISAFCSPEHPEYMPRRREMRRSLGIPDEAFVLGAVGRLTRDKGIAELLQAYEHVRTLFPQTRLLLIGDFEPGDRPAEKWVRSITDDPAIHWTGAVDDASSYYSCMDVLVHASKREGLPYVPLEAAASGVPVVGYRVTGVVDAVCDAETGLLVSPGDVSALAQAAARYLADPALRQRHGRAGRSRIQREFSQKAVWDNLRSEYLRLSTTSLPGRDKEGVGVSCCPTTLRKLRGRSRFRTLTKRLLDVAIAVPIAVACTPLLAVLAVFIRLHFGKPVIFWQQRTGHRGQRFWMPKFRTMTNERGPDGALLSDAERLTRFGKWLRSTSLDELPELWNVLRGEMSLVGPRPLLPEYLEHYTPEQARRHDVKPGLTGWAQVNGRNGISWEEKFKLDVWYVNHQSLALDLTILLRTFITLLSRKGIAAGDHVTMPRFDRPAPTAVSYERAA